VENENRPIEETPEEIEEKERQAKIRWQIYAAGLDPARAAPPAPGYGLDGYPLQAGKGTSSGASAPPSPCAGKAYGVPAGAGAGKENERLDAEK
jgi:hypothetical protein